MMGMTMKITTKYTTICTVGYTGSVGGRQDQRAHGGVCHIEVRKVKSGIIARKVNSNGRYQEIGKAFTPTTEEIAHWELLDKSSR
jgi:hypothetical protein